MFLRPSKRPGWRLRLSLLSRHIPGYQSRTRYTGHQDQSREKHLIYYRKKQPGTRLSESGRVNNRSKISKQSLAPFWKATRPLHQSEDGIDDLAMIDTIWQLFTSLYHCRFRSSSMNCF
jgi:hypothetical protein